MSERKKISEPWTYEVCECDLETGIFRMNLYNLETGEIRQKQRTLDFIARRLFQSELRTWRKRGGKYWEVKTEPIVHEARGL